MLEMSEFDILNAKIQEKLSRDNVIDNKEEVSLKTVNDSLDSAFGSYNKCFVKDEQKFVKLVNKRIKRLNIFSNNIPYILDFCPSINEDGSYYIDVLFTDSDYRFKGKATIDTDFNINLDYLKDNYSKERLLKVLSDYKNIYASYFELLNNFKNEYPNTSYAWNADLSIGKLVVDDGFNVAYLYLENTDHPVVSFSNSSDLSVSRYHSKKYGELYDYIDAFKYSILRKMKVNINDLNPLFQKVVRKELGLNDEKSLSLKKDN